MLMRKVFLFVFVALIDLALLVGMYWLGKKSIFDMDSIYLISSYDQVSVKLPSDAPTSKYYLLPSSISYNNKFCYFSGNRFFTDLPQANGKLELNGVVSDEIILINSDTQTAYTFESSKNGYSLNASHIGFRKDGYILFHIFLSITTIAMGTGILSLVNLIVFGRQGRTSKIVSICIFCLMTFLVYGVAYKNMIMSLI